VIGSSLGSVTDPDGFEWGSAAGAADANSDGAIGSTTA
jgi:hypothetical protein